MGVGGSLATVRLPPLLFDYRKVTPRPKADTKSQRFPKTKKNGGRTAKYGQSDKRFASKSIVHRERIYS